MFVLPGPRLANNDMLKHNIAVRVCGFLLRRPNRRSVAQKRNGANQTADQSSVNRHNAFLLSSEFLVSSFSFLVFG
jgi:hypothetical protein